MDVFEALARRHSYRGEFTAAAVPREHLRRIAEAGLQAPSACNEQTPSLVIVDDPALLAALAAIVDRPVMRTARAAIVCVADHRPVYRNLSFAAEDCAAAVENMLLAVTALGYATVWLDGALRSEGRAERIGELLGVPPRLQVRVLLPLGVPAAAVRPPEKKPFHERAWFNRYGAAEA